MKKSLAARSEISKFVFCARLVAERHHQMIALREGLKLIFEWLMLMPTPVFYNDDNELSCVVFKKKHLEDIRD
jgi:hypothetical protein